VTLQKLIRAASLAVLMVAAVIAGATLSSGQVKPGPLPTPPNHRSTQTPTSEQKPPESTITVEAALVNLDVLVTDQDSRVLGGLQRENFRVSDNGQVQQVTHFEPVGAPITIAMLMEYSGLAYDYFAYKSASWGSTLLNHLEPLDYVALVTYDIKPTVRMDFTRNKAEMNQVLSSLSYPEFREANLYGALIDTIDRLDHVKGKKAILLVTTGMNTMSSYTLDDAMKRIKQSDAVIFVVGVAESEYMTAETQISGLQSISYLQAKNQLMTFAKMSGGSFWFPRFEGEIPGIFKSAATFLRSQFRIGFTPASLVHDGKYHKLKVEIVRPDGTQLIVTTPSGKKQKPVVYAREGYTAPGSGSRK
jgi:Ca-activated chloride channel family protein